MVVFHGNIMICPLVSSNWACWKIHHVQMRVPCVRWVKTGFIPWIWVGWFAMQQDEDLPGLAQGVATKTNVPKIDSPRRNKDDPVIIDIPSYKPPLTVDVPRFSHGFDDFSSYQPSFFWDFPACHLAIVPRCSTCRRHPMIIPSPHEVYHIVSSWHIIVVREIQYTHVLVGGWPTPLQNMKVSWDYYSQYMEK